MSRWVLHAPGEAESATELSRGSEMAWSGSTDSGRETIRPDELYELQNQPSRVEGALPRKR
jgi:hypothetical protein